MNNQALVFGLIAVVVIGGIALVYTNQDNKDDTLEAEKNVMENRQNTKPVTTSVPVREENGVMVGGAMMLPSLNIVENAMKARNVTTVVAALSAAGLTDTLKGPGPFTVFAPSNAAFEKLPAGTVESLLKAENKAKLSSILAYHVVAGEYTSADLKDGQKLKTVNGQEITIKKDGNKITVNGNAMVETADVISSNGVTYVIDTVLMPK